MNIKDIDFCGSFTQLEKMPKDRLPEIAFIGRSNVGKSSLINNLCNRKIAKTSSTPGKTQLINFFKINRKFYLVDLPGYGYAKVALDVKKKWEAFIDIYLQKRETLKAVFLLLDIRREPNDHDKMLTSWIKSLSSTSDLRPVYVLTKADKLGRSAIAKNKAEIAKALFISQHEMFIHSSVSGNGKKELLKCIDEILTPPAENLSISDEDEDGFEKE